MISTNKKRKIQQNIPESWQMSLNEYEVEKQRAWANKHLKTIIEKISDGIVIVSKDGYILSANPAAETLLGEEKGKLTNNPFGFPVIKGDFTEIDLIKKNGTTATVEMRTTEIEWGDDLAYLITLHDITHLKKIESALRRSEEKFKSIFDKSLDVILLINRETGKILQVNKSVKKVLGYNSMDLIGIKLEKLIDKKNNENKNPLMLNTIRDTVIEALEIKCADDTICIMDLTAKIITWDADEVILLTLRDVSERLETKEEISRLASVVRQANVTVVITDLNGDIEYVNPAFEKISGYSADEVLGKNPKILQSGDHDIDFYRNLWNTILSGKNWKGIFINRKKDGSRYYEDSVIFPIKDDEGKIINFAAVKRDITAERNLQDQLIQMQKLESIGLLAGGIAHDFNNIIISINGNAELLLEELKGNSEYKGKVVSILKAGKRASGLTRQLLAFSRKQMAELKIVNVNELILDIYKMLKRLISEDIKLVKNIYAKDCNIKADPAQIEQILINLAINARDAINQKVNGSANKIIRIKTTRKVLDENFVLKHPGSNTGPHIVISVSDNGIGMEKEMINKIYEPFFTTKPEGKGTGLGLSMVYGIVKQNNGSIYATSKYGQGTCFDIYWPESSDIQQTEVIEEKEVQFKGGETILIVEDDESVREIAAATLKSVGYNTLEATNGKEALEYLKSKDKNVSLILSDVVMPEMGGKELAKKVKKQFSNIKILFSSGYAEDQIAESGILNDDVDFITKPYALQALQKKVREILDRKH